MTYFAQPQWAGYCPICLRGFRLGLLDAHDVGFRPPSITEVHIEITCPDPACPGRPELSRT